MALLQINEHFDYFISRLFRIGRGCPLRYHSSDNLRNSFPAFFHRNALQWDWNMSFWRIFFLIFRDGGNLVGNKTNETKVFNFHSEIGIDKWINRSLRSNKTTKWYSFVFVKLFVYFLKANFAISLFKILLRIALSRVFKVSSIFDFSLTCPNDSFWSCQSDHSRLLLRFFP